MTENVLLVLHSSSSSDNFSSRHSSISSASLSCAPQISEDQDCDSLSQRRREQLSLLALLLTFLRKCLTAACHNRETRRELCTMEISWPTNVQHVAHVTFDGFSGFMGLPEEFEPELPTKPPSASRTVFGVSTKSMQLSYDSRGNSVPTILLLMQGRLYAEGGLQAEGIFRINGENSQEEHIRDQLNRGDVPVGIDIHCLAGLIKAWFSELPVGLLDSLSPEQVMKCKTEEDCLKLVKLLPPTEVGLLDWAVNLMVDVVQHEHLNKMNARNIAMVFAPNMTQMADALTALKYAVQVIHFLKTLIMKTMRERKESVLEPCVSCVEPYDDNGHHSSLKCSCEDVVQDNNKDSSVAKIIRDGSDRYSTTAEVDILVKKTEIEGDSGKSKPSKFNDSSLKRGTERISEQAVVWRTGPFEQARGISNLSRIDSRNEMIEAWR